MTVDTKNQQQKLDQNKLYTWKQISNHNSHDDCWLVIDGIVYDVTKWADTHPGGDMILLGGGTDASIMASSYHPAGINAELLKKYQIGLVQNSQQGNKIEREEESFYDKLSTDEFYNALKMGVLDYFKKNKISSRRGEGAPLMFVKATFILVNFFVGLYYMTVYGSFIAALWMGTMAAEIGINVMHDGSHGAFSKFNILNYLTCWTMDMIGASSYVWESQHVGGHHLWTNLDNEKAHNSEVDPDVFSSYPLIKMHPHSENKWFHKYQHIYGPILFMTFTMAKVLYNDFACFYYNQVMHISMNQRLSSKKNLIRIIFWKTLSLGYMMILPMIYNGFTKGFALFMVAHLACGTILAFMFIVTHITEGCNFLEKGHTITSTELQLQAIEKSKKKFGITKTTKKASEHSWAAMQCRTSINWCLDSVFWSNFSGGLNHQIEHHLFPGICHMHYQNLRDVIEKTCAEYEVPYIRYDTFMGAVSGMINHLRIMGNTPQLKKQQ